MLASLLPGFREARVALSAGYLYLLAFYVFLREPIARAVEQDPDLNEAVRAVQEAFGDIGIGAAVTFAALLVGSLATDFTNALVVRAGRRRGLSRRGYAALLAVSEDIGRQVAPLSTDARQRLMTDHPHVADALVRELPLVRTRLLAEDREVFNEVSRLEGEAEFRVAVGVALLFVALAGAFRFHPLWGLGVFPAGLLSVLGLYRAREAGDLLADMLLLKRVRAPLMDRIAAELEGGR